MTQQTQSQAVQPPAQRKIPEWFVSHQYGVPILYHHVAGADVLWSKQGRWAPTDDIADWLVGENMYLEPVTEAEARRAVPAAFS